MTMLVTGGTGTLGRPTVSRLRDAGHDVRVLSRTPGEGRVAGDLTTGDRLAPALDGVDTVLHLASDLRTDVAQTRNLLDASRAAGVRHLIYISIVGIDRIPYSYYQAKLECERLIEASDVPSTILRATQFHDFVDRILGGQRRLPVIVVPAVPDQPIAVEEVADRLVELAGSAPAGRVGDVGGPEQLAAKDLARMWRAAVGSRKPIWSLPLPGRVMRAFRAGHHMPGLPGYGRQTFVEYAARLAARRAAGD